VREDLESGLLSAGHARTLLALENERTQLGAWAHFKSSALSVRQAEEYVRELLAEPSASRRSRPELSPDWLAMQEHLCQHLGTAVRIRAANGGKGRIELLYNTPRDLERLVEMLIYSGEVAWQAG
jgi:ParB family chromosome partitioning protein